MSMKDFSIINKIGNYLSLHYLHIFIILMDAIGDGAYSVVYKVKRVSDG